MESSDTDGLSLLRLDESRLPLHLFDACDSKGELEALLSRGVVGKQGLAPYYLGSAAGWGWKEVVIEGVDLGGAADVGALAVRFVESGKKKTVKRLDCFINGEDTLAAFGARVGAALRAREASKAGLRFQHLVDTLALPQECAPIQDVWLARIYTRALAAKRSYSAQEARLTMDAARRLDPRAAEVAEELEASAAAARTASIAAVTAGGAPALAASLLAARGGAPSNSTRGLPSGGAPGRTLPRGGGGPPPSTRGEVESEGRASSMSPPLYCPPLIQIRRRAGRRRGGRRRGQYDRGPVWTPYRDFPHAPPLHSS